MAIWRFLLKQKAKLIAWTYWLHNPHCLVMKFCEFYVDFTRALPCVLKLTCILYSVHLYMKKLWFYTRNATGFIWKIHSHPRTTLNLSISTDSLVICTKSTIGSTCVNTLSICVVNVIRISTTTLFLPSIGSNRNNWLGYRDGWSICILGDPWIHVKLIVSLPWTYWTFCG